MHFARLACLVGLGLGLARSADAQNRIYMDNEILEADEGGQELLVRIDNSIDVYAISLSIAFDPALLQVTGIEPAGVAASAEWEAGTAQDQVDNVDGEIIYGLLTEFDFSGDDAHIPPGSGQVVARIEVQTAPTARTSTTIDFRDDLGDTAFGAVNALVDSLGNSYRNGSARPLTLGDATLTIDPLEPLIQLVENNDGMAGDVFRVVGRNFDQPGLAVTVCDQPALATLEPDGQTLLVTAPSCPTCPDDVECCAVVEVCTENGCDSQADAFCYQPPPRPQISSKSLNSGLAGRQFFVGGANFTQDGLTVQVCGVDADFSVLGDTSLSVIAPACATTGWAPLEICNVHGCASDPEGFFYEVPPAPVIGTLVDNQGLAGTVFQVAGDNFSRPGLIVRVCDVQAEHSVIDDDNLQVTAPDCAQLGWSLLEICNDFGCDDEPDGFFYEEPPPPPLPEITSLTSNQGRPGDEFFVDGDHFDEPGLAVELCGVAATHELIDATRLRVVAPDCAAGWSLLRICTDSGCVEETEGFLYEPPPVPSIGAIVDNSGLAGAVFEVQGANFQVSSLQVGVCEVAATFEVVDDTLLRVTAPDCAATGWAPLEVCNDHGCTTEPNGYFYEEPPPDPVPQIASASGNQGQGGQEFTVLGQNFDQPSLQVTLCGQPATVNVVDAATLRVTAPDCETLGFSELQVCNVFGCDAIADGFLYEEPPPDPVPVVSTLVDNSGLSGRVFSVTGENFVGPNLGVSVCGQAAAFDLDGGTSMAVTAPDCAQLGWAVLEICNDFGCAVVTEGFLYEEPPPDPVPAISNLSDNRGQAGREFHVTGENFDQAGLAVTVCGQPAAFEPAGAGQLVVTSPECAQLGWAEIEVCNDFGCDSLPEGFLYEEPPPDPRPVIAGASQHRGLEGQVFEVTGENFDEPFVVVSVCGVEAVYEVVDATLLRVTAPACAQLGWASLQVCNAHGCDQLAEGFFYEEPPPGTPFLRGDANGDGRQDISDATTILFDQFLGVPARAECRDALDVNDDGSVDISDPIRLLQWQFVGGPPPAPPHPEPGLDPTPDSLPEC